MKKCLMEIRLYKKEFGAEIILCLITLIASIVSIYLPQNVMLKVESFLLRIVTTDRISLLTNIAAIFIGIYTNVLIVLATSRLSITEFLLEKKLDKRILTVIEIGIIENFLLIIIAFFNIKNCTLLILYMALVIISLIAFLKFMFTVYRIFKINIIKMVKEIDKDNKERTDLIIRIDEELYILKKIDSKINSE